MILKLNNSYDLGPVVAHVRHALDHAMGAGASRKPLVILAGEVHKNPAHVLLHQALLEMLLERRELTGEKFGCGWEDSPSSFLESAWGEPEFSRVSLDTVASNPGLVLKAKIAFKDAAAYAPAANRNLAAFCYKNDVYPDLNDLNFSPYGTCGGNLVYTKDAASRARKRYSKIGHAFNPLYGDGMDLRNWDAAERIVTRIKKEGLPVYYKRCGIAHVFGDVEYNSPYKNSLHACLRRMGVDVIAIYPLMPKDYSPLKIQDMETRGIVIAGLDDTVYSGFDLAHLEEEKVRDICRETGLEYAGDGYALRQNMKAVLQQDIAALSAKPKLIARNNGSVRPAAAAY